MTTLTPEQEAARSVDTAGHWGSGTITEISENETGWTVSLEGSGFGLSREKLGDADPPQVGDEVVLYTHRGSMIRGLDLRGEPVFYMTDREIEIEDEKWRAEYKEKQRKEFEEQREELDRKFAALPEVFQRRVQWFRDHNPDFRWQNEAYELSSCVDAVKIAEAMETPEGVQRFKELTFEQQRAAVPDLYDGHSGNSFGMACRLAWLYLTDPLLVVAEHGAMVPLTGCEKYGCAHPRPDDVMEAVARHFPEEE